MRHTIARKLVLSSWIVIPNDRVVLVEGPIERVIIDRGLIPLRGRVGPGGAHRR